MFDVNKLELMLIEYTKQGDAGQTDFISSLTALARQCPHSIVELDSDLNYKILQLEPRKEEMPGEGDEPPKPSIVKGGKAEAPAKK